MRNVDSLTMLLVCLALGVGFQSQSDEKHLAALFDQWVSARNANNLDQMRPLFEPQMDHVNMGTGEVIATDREGSVSWFDLGFRAQRTGSAQGSTFRVSKQKIRVLSPEA